MVIQNLTRSLGEFFVEAGFALDAYIPQGIIDTKTKMVIGRYDVGEWVDLRVRFHAWELYGKEIKQVVEKYEKFSGLQVFVKIS